MIVRALLTAILCTILILPGMAAIGPGLFQINTAEAASTTAASQRLHHHYRQIGTASWYGGKFAGRLTASGKPFDVHHLTAAHRSLPLGTKARVTNLENGRSIEVTVTDRGPYVAGRVIDLSERAAKLLGMKKDGLALVAIDVQPGEAS
jgi:rare lipoprotein A